MSTNEPIAADAGDVSVGPEPGSGSASDAAGGVEEAPRVWLSAPDVTELEVGMVVDALRSGWVAPLGPEVDAFERDIAEFTGMPYAAALSSGTAGLHLALRYVGVEPGSRVYVPTITFGATAFAVTYCGAQPVFLDSENVTWNLDPDVLAQVLAADAARGQLPAAILTVDLFGRTCDYDRIMPLAEEYAVPVIEDAAEALGATHHERAAGSFGRAGIFSFNGNKIMTTSGGGMVVTDDADLADRLRFWATQSREPFPWYEHEEIGFNYRMSNILAALGRGQLIRLPEMIARRRQINERYTDGLRQVDGVEVLGDPPWGLSNAWLTTIRFDPAAHPGASTRVREHLAEQNIECRPVWKPMHAQPVFEQAERHLTGAADAIFAEGLCLPSGVATTDDDVDRVVAGIQEVLR